MSTAFSKVVSAVIARLSAQPAVCKAIYRARSHAIPEQDDEAISVQWERSLPAPGAINGAPIDWSTTVTVDCFAKTASVNGSGDVAVDPLLERVFERLGADPTLGGLIDDLVIAGVEAESTAEAKKTGWVRLTYVADHRTSNSILSGT